VMSRFTLELGRAVQAHPSMHATISVSRQNELYADFAELAPDLFPIDTFRAGRGAALEAWRIPGLRRRLVERLRRDDIEVVVDLLPHVWSPLVASAIVTAGVRYVPLIHDADRHPGDPTAWGMAFANRCVRQADIVLTLSHAVADRLVARRMVPRDKLATLFLPDLHYGPPAARELLRQGEPLRLAFFGRIMPYKGLLMFVEAMERLRAAGVNVQVGVFGEGALGACAGRLKQFGAEVVNRWLGEEEVGRILSGYHALVLSHIAASQSAVAATAFGLGLPVVANPIGGLGEQIADGHTGIIAKRADAQALAEAVMRLLDPELYSHICRTIAASKDQRSMLRFAELCGMHASRGACGIPASAQHFSAQARANVNETELCAHASAAISEATAPARCSTLADRAPCEVFGRTLRDMKTTLAGGKHRSG
jgi:glycosyltransferase involved in cell wall biosynthesis